MQDIRVGTIDELRSALAVLGEGLLFRGQTGRYKLGNGADSITTSFHRRGCYPPQMLKWSHYARSAMNAFVKAPSGGFDLRHTQAVLQHYGWTSFFVDVTPSAAAASWFASNRYIEHRSIDLSENYLEEPVWLVNQIARYEPADDVGHIYAISREVLRSLKVQEYDLSSLEVVAGRPRFVAQAGWLIGPLRRAVPPAAIVAHIEAPVAALSKFAAAGGFHTQDDLFPSPDTDPLLAYLLSLPWLRVPDPSSETGPLLRAYRRAIEIPEYHHVFRKRLPPSVAFYDGVRFTDDEHIALPSEAIAVSLPSEAYFGTSDAVPIPMPHLSKLVSSHEFTILEIDELIRVPHHNRDIEYTKGLFLRNSLDGVEVCELVVDHPGNEVHGFGANAGWYYKIGDTGEWSRTKGSNDCPCDNVLRHSHHLAVLHRVETLLAEGALHTRVVPARSASGE